MKKIRFIFLTILIILLTGCTGNYNIKINEDLSVNEKLNLEINNTSNTYETVNKIFRENNINNDKYHVAIVDDKVQIDYKEKFESIEDYLLNSKVYHQLIDEIKYQKNKNYIDIYINQNLKMKNDNDDILFGNMNDLEHLQINITNPYKIVTTNAESSNNNKYTWTIDKNTINKKIIMQFNPNKTKSYIRPIVVGIVLIISISILAYIITKNYKEKTKI